MGRPQFHLSDDQARILSESVNILLVEQLRLPFRERNKNYRQFLSGFIRATYKATNQVFGAGMYRKLLSAYAPGITPATATIDSEKKKFVERLISEQKPMHEQFIKRKKLSPTSKALSPYSAGVFNSLEDRHKYPDESNESQIKFLQKKLVETEQNLLRFQNQASQLAVKLQERESNSLAIEHELASLKIRLSQRNEEMVSSPAFNHMFGPVVDDWAAIEMWLTSLRVKSKKEVSQTEITYRYHLQKLRWYCENYVGLTPSKWTADDVKKFLLFLRNLPEAVISRRQVDRDDPEWTPFKCKPSKNSQSDIRRFVHAMFQALQRIGYIRINPMFLQATQSKRKLNVERVVTTDLFEIVLDVMSPHSELTFSQRQRLARDRFIMLALRDLGLRASELVLAKMSAFYQLTSIDNTKIYWIFRVNAESAKGSAERVIPVTSILWDAFIAYRTAFGLSREPDINENGALILSVKKIKLTEEDICLKDLNAKHFFKTWKEISTRQGLYKIVKYRLVNAGDYLISTGQKQKAELLKEASPHWLRHTFGTSALLYGQTMREVASELGHRSIETIFSYAKQDVHTLLESWERTNPGSLAVKECI